MNSFHQLEIYSLTGETIYNSGEKGEPLRAQINEERKGQIVEELHFGVIFIADGSEAINVSTE